MKETSTNDRTTKYNRYTGRDQEVTTTGKEKPTLSYIGLISMAILSAPEQRMLLSEIYSWIAKNFPYYKQKDRSWRNSIRHNLSLNECFIKAGRSETGKGNYWTIHPANTSDFGQGDFRRRRARRRVRQCNEELERLKSGLLGIQTSLMSNESPQNLLSSGNVYVPMTSTWISKSILTSIFGPEIVLSPEEKKCAKGKTHASNENGVSYENTWRVCSNGENYSFLTHNYLFNPPLKGPTCTIQQNAQEQPCCYFQQNMLHSMEPGFDITAELCP